DGVTGFLFRDVTEFEAKAERLAVDRGLRERLGLAGRQLVEHRYPPQREIEGYLSVYARLAPVASTRRPGPPPSARGLPDPGSRRPPVTRQDVSTMLDDGRPPGLPQRVSGRRWLMFTL